MSKSSSVIGRKGYELSIYNYAINDLMKNVKDEMVKQSIDKISNARITVEFPQGYKLLSSSIRQIIVIFTGTALKRQK